MKKILFLILFLSGTMFSQQLTGDNPYKTEFKKDPLNYRSLPFVFYSISDTTYWNPVHVNGVITVGTIAIGTDALQYGTNTISSVEVLGGDVACKKIVLTNYTNGSIVYVGGDNSVTSSSGIPLNYLDTYTLTVSNLNKVWLISGSSTDVRFNYEN